MNFEVNGSFLKLYLDVGEVITTEGRKAAWIRGKVEIKTSVKGSIDLAVDVVADTLFVSTFTCRDEDAEIGFGLNASGSVVEQELGEGEEIIAKRGILLAVEPSAKIEMVAQKKMELSGNYRKVTGPGLALWDIQGGGREFSLEKGVEMLVDPAFLAMYQPSIGMTAVRMHGAKQKAGSNAELSMTMLRGPGKVWLQNR